MDGEQVENTPGVFDPVLAGKDLEPENPLAPVVMPGGAEEKRPRLHVEGPARQASGKLANILVDITHRHVVGVSRNICGRDRAEVILLAEGLSTLAAVDDQGKLIRVPQFMYPD